VIKVYLGGLAAFALASCASTQLTYNTIDIASNIDSLLTKEALTNLSKFIDNPFSIPSQLDIQAGTIQTSNAITPSVGFPLSSQIASTAQRAGSALTLSDVSTKAGSTAALSGTNVQQQNWNVTPLTDANTLRNLQALYRHAVYGIPLQGNYVTSRVFVDNKFFPDPYLLQKPHCVLCAVADASALVQSPAVYVNPRLHSLWLYWTGSPASGNQNMPTGGQALVDLGYFGNHELYMTREDYANGYLTDFVFFILPNTEPVEVFASGGGGGGKQLNSAAPSTNGRINSGAGRQNFNVIVPQGIQPGM
jgi:hypothetical protein